MKKLYSIFALSLMLINTNAQTINFNGCHNLFDDNNYIFTKTETDAQGKGVYITTPVDGEQSCSGLGTCEFKIQWNNTLKRWEFLADSGNGDFINPYLVFYNSKGNNNASNPPSPAIGIWEENKSITESKCGGNLSPTNTNMTGDVHTTTLAVNDLDKGKIQLFPNPVTSIINISGIQNGEKIMIYTMSGQLIQSENFSSKINVSQLNPGTYILYITSKDEGKREFKFIKK